MSKNLEWWKSFEIKLNQNKSGVMRLLYRSGKIKGTINTVKNLKLVNTKIYVYHYKSKPKL